MLDALGVTDGAVHVGLSPFDDLVEVGTTRTSLRRSDAGLLPALRSLRTRAA